MLIQKLNSKNITLQGESLKH